MLDLALLVGLPYLALGFLVVGSIARYRMDRFSYSSLSSQFLEDKMLFWGTLPWHAGIILVGLGHLVVFAFPGTWHKLMANEGLLITVEVLGLAASFLCVFGLAILIYRRITHRLIQAVTSTADIVILFVLLFQIILGIATAISYKWGSSWSTGTVVPFVWSLLKLQPNLGLAAELPGLVKLHIIFAAVLAALTPFTRLVHIFSFPFTYFFRPHQLVIWQEQHRFTGKTQEMPPLSADESRRQFIRAAIGVGIGGAVPAVVSAVGVTKFLKGPTLSKDTEEELLARRLKQADLTRDGQVLMLERMRLDLIEVADLSELQETTGKYFIDYEMRPALAFVGPDGLPNLISAKCTHLGCTVSNQVDSGNNVLCPCHISYFNIETGKPNDGAPAKVALPKIGWILKDKEGRFLMSKSPMGSVEGELPTGDELQGAKVYTSKQFAKGNA
jgi:nitrate reductase gamma subunit